MLVKSTVEEFCRVLGSSAPAPGGGSVSALSGALGAELVAMVCRLSQGKEDLLAHQKLLATVLDQAEALAASLLGRVDRDTEAFNEVMAAFKMPKGTETEKSARSAAIQAGYQEAVRSPLGIARECLEVLRLAEGILDKFNLNALSDLGVAAMEARAGLEGAAMNVRINLPSIKDQAFVSTIGGEVARYLERGDELCSRVYRYVQDNLT